MILTRSLSCWTCFSTCGNRAFTQNSWISILKRSKSLAVRYVPCCVAAEFWLPCPIHTLALIWLTALVTLLLGMWFYKHKCTRSVMSWRKSAQKQMTHIPFFHIKVTDRGKQDRQYTYTWHWLAFAWHLLLWNSSTYCIFWVRVHCLSYSIIICGLSGSTIFFHIIS